MKSFEPDLSVDYPLNPNHWAALSSQTELSDDGEWLLSAARHLTDLKVVQCMFKLFEGAS